MEYSVTDFEEPYPLYFEKMSDGTTNPSPRRVGPMTVTPQQVTDPTILDSVTGFINEVVPTANTVHYDIKDQIQWARFEQIDQEEMQLIGSDNEKMVPTPVILVLGYTTGIQMWAIPANGEATEILSWRHGSVRVLRILPNPYVLGKPNKIDVFAPKRPLVALCDSSSSSPQFSSVNMISLKTGEQVKVIKFKSQILDILANKRSIVVSFQEKVAIFDAFTFDDRLTVTTCYLSPGLNPNPLALGSRWMAYAEKKLILSKRSSGGNEGEGLQSYTATVLHAAKSLGRGLRELGESVASSLTGTPNVKTGTSPNSPQAGGSADIPQKGIITILDIENPISPSSEKSNTIDPIVAHFVAHTEAIVHLKFDPSGLLLFTADKRGHDFHLFRIHPHPAGPALAAVHHLYILHRGDTSAKVQDMCFSPDSRWAAVSTLRGTTHVFPITPYGGNVGVRTHATPHVVNKMSRFHRSAGLTADGRSDSPVSMTDTTISSSTSHFPFHNPRFPPYPHPTVINPLAQIRQPLYVQNIIGGASPRQQSGRQRLSSSSEDNVSLQVVACFAAPRAWLCNTPRDAPLVIQTKPPPVDALFVMSCHGNLLQYDLDPHQASNIPKEKVCSETPIELTVTAKAQWALQRQVGADDLPLPMLPGNIGFIVQEAISKKEKPNHNDDNWLSQVEIITHAGPHRRLWMGPQFTFKTYTTTSGSINEAQPIDLGHTKPVNMPIAKANAVLIESSSASSCEQVLLDNYRKAYEEAGGAGELQLKEDLADAMLESPGIRDTGGRCVIVQMKPAVAKVVNPLGTVVNVHSDEDTDIELYEETVIHENCDEALFRPVVAPKAVLHNGKLKRYGDNIITKSLEATTEVAVKILNRSAEKIKFKSRESSPKKIKEDKKVVEGKKISVDEKKSNKIDKKESLHNSKYSNDKKIDLIYEKTIPEVITSSKLSKSEKPPESFVNISEVVKIDNPPKPSKSKRIPESRIKLPVTEPFVDIFEEIKSTTSKHFKDVVDLPVPKPLEKIDVNLSQDNRDLILDLPPLENEDFFSLENIAKPDMFEDARDYGENFTDLSKDRKKVSKSKKDKIQLAEPLEENIVEDKRVIKKFSKPKTKLGVKIATINNENLKPEKPLDNFSTEITLPPPKSWSSIAASKPVSTEKSSFDNEEKEKPSDWDLPPIEFVVEIDNPPLPKKSYSSCITSNLIDIETPQEDKKSKRDLDKNIHEIVGDVHLLKIDRSSDDEKAESSSSQTEVTESDDSGKIPAASSGFEDLSESSTAAPVSKTSRRRKKRK